MCKTAKNASLKYVHCTYLHCLFTSLEATVLHLIASVSSLKHYLFASRTVSSLHVSEADVTHEHLDVLLWQNNAAFKAENLISLQIAPRNGAV